MNSNDCFDKFANLVISAEELSDDEINAFKETLPGADGKALFDRLGEIRRRIMVLLSRMSDDQIIDLKKNLGTHPPLVHDFQTVQQYYELCMTPDIRKI